TESGALYWAARRSPGTCRGGAGNAAHCRLDWNHDSGAAASARDGPAGSTVFTRLYLLASPAYLSGAAWIYSGPGRTAYGIEDPARSRRVNCPGAADS